MVSHQSATQSTQPVLRSRDIWAAVALVWLSSAAFSSNNGADDRSLAASIRLAFYIPRSPQHDKENHNMVLIPSAFDVDGDGSPEALALWTESTANTPGQSNWTLQVLDLRPASPTSYAATSTVYSFLPFRPKVLLESTSSIMGTTLSTASLTERSDGTPTEIPFFPLAQCTGHVTFVTHKNDTSKINDMQAKEEKIDKTLFYYCGADWHDASQKCATPCPSGQSQHCPAGERCFADTSCAASSSLHASDASEQGGAASSDGSTSWHKTQAGGWPSVFTVWSQGRITMHSLTAEQDTTVTDKKNSRRTTKSPLKMVPQWDVSILSNSTNVPPNSKLLLEMEEVAVQYLDAVSAELATQGFVTNAGLVLVSGTVTAYVPPDQLEDDDRSPEDGVSSPFVLALDAATGFPLWRTISSVRVESLLYPPPVNETAKALPLPVLLSRGSTSGLRRRSGVLSSDRPYNLLLRGHFPGTSQVNCLQEYRRSLFTAGALPYQYWGRPEDAQVLALHFDHQAGGGNVHSANGRASGRAAKRGRQHRTTKSVSHRRRNAANRKSASRSLTSRSWLSTKKASQRHKQSFLEYGRPNVVVTHNYHGIEVFSLRNGRPICHLSLSNHMLYADMNHDGSIDSVQTITASSHGQALLQRADDDEAISELQWVEGLAKRVSSTNGVGTLSTNERLPTDFAPSQLCHLLALSGIPSREELFSVNLCASHADQYLGGSTDGNRSNSIDAQRREHHMAAVAAHHGEIHGGPLLLVESISNDGIPSGNDIVAALNTGAVSRIRGRYGHVVWHANEKNYHSLPYTAVYPTWDNPSVVALSRIESFNVIAPTRPILLAGQNSVAIFAPLSGKLLAAAAFPQLSMSRPVVTDLNGDGTSDMIYVSADAIWGYVVVVRTGASTFFQIVVGLLLMAIMLAFLRNRFGPHPGKRSTDL